MTARENQIVVYQPNETVRLDICGFCHDRFPIVNQKEIFRTGASLTDAGRLTFAAAKIDAEVIPGLLESIRKATSEPREYGEGTCF